MTRRFLLKLLALFPFLRRFFEPAPELAGWDTNAPSTPWKSYTGGYVESWPPPTECYGIPFWLVPGKVDKESLLKILRAHQAVAVPRVTELIVGSEMHELVMAEAGRLFSRGSIELTVESGRAVRSGSAPVRVSKYLRPREVIIKYSDETLAHCEWEE